MKKAEVIVNTSMVSGLWKFANVPFETLVNLAEEWLEAEGDKYVDLHVRKCSKGQIAIGFKYLFEGDDHKRFFHKITDQLKRRFGNDFIGYDVSSPTWLIQKPKKIIVTRRGERNYIARLEHLPQGLFGQGRSMEEAVGTMILNCQPELNFQFDPHP